MCLISSILSRLFDFNKKYLLMSKNFLTYTILKFKIKTINQNIDLNSLNFYYV